MANPPVPWDRVALAVNLDMVAGTGPEILMQNTSSQTPPVKRLLTGSLMSYGLQG